MNRTSTMAVLLEWVIQSIHPLILLDEVTMQIGMLSAFIYAGCRMFSISIIIMSVCICSTAYRIIHWCIRIVDNNSQTCQTSQIVSTFSHIFPHSESNKLKHCVVYKNIISSSTIKHNTKQKLIILFLSLSFVSGMYHSVKFASDFIFLSIYSCHLLCNMKTIY